MGYQDTWLLASCLIVNNFLVADQMRRLTSVAKQLGAGIDDFFRQVEGFYCQTTGDLDGLKMWIRRQQMKIEDMRSMNIWSPREI